MSWRAAVSANARQIRIFFDSSAKEGAGLRSFVEKNYQELKMLNPATPFLIRLRDGAPTQIWIKDHNGDEMMRALDGASEEQCEAALRELVLTAGKEPVAVEPIADYVVEFGHEGLVPNPWLNEFVDDAEMKRRVVD